MRTAVNDSYHSGGKESTENRSNTRKKIDWLNLHPVAYVVKRITLTEGRYKGRDLAVAVVIADMMGPEGKGPSGEEVQVCFASLDTIAKRAHYGKSTVQRTLNETLCDGETPLFKRTLGGVTRGHLHQCYWFELIRNPAAFASARDKVRPLKSTDSNFRQEGESN